MLRRSVGGVGVVLSILGLITCLAGAAAVWPIKHRVERITTAGFTAADDAFEFITSRLTRVQVRVDSAAQQTQGLAARVDRLQAAITASRPDTDGEVESMRVTLDALIDELHTAEGWLDSIEVVARGMHSAATSIAESRNADAAAPATSSPAGDPGITAERVAELSADLIEVIRRIDALRSDVLELRENRIVARGFAAAMIAEAARLDTRFADLARRIDELNGRVHDRQAATAAIGRSVRGWITFGSVVLVVGLLWFACSQACVLDRAWRMRRTLPDPPS